MRSLLSMRRGTIENSLLRMASRLLPAKIKRRLVRSPLLHLALPVSPAIRRRLSVSGISASQRRQLAQCSVDLRRQGDWEGIQQLIDSVLAGKHFGLPPAYARGFAAGLRGVSEDSARHPDITSDLVSATKHLDPMSAVPEIFVALSALAISHGLFEVSGAARALAIESALARGRSASATTQELLTALRAALDRHDLTLAHAFRERLHAMPNQQPAVALTTVDQYLGLLPGTRTHLSVALGQTESDRLWATLVSGRTVALVGPAPAGAPLGQEIDNHDLVARTNYRGKQKLPPALETGARTDVSYYNGMDCRQIRDEDDRSFFTELRMAVFKGSSGAELSGTTPARVAKSPDPLLFTGSPLMGTIALFDLICGGGLVKLYNMNFFASQRPYFAGYRSQSTDARGLVQERDHLHSRGMQLDRCSSFSNHDLQSQLRFVQKLWRSGLVTADASCTEVLQMSDTDYLRALDNIYGREAR